MPSIKLIAAIDDKRGLARSGRIPWDLPGDRQRFRCMTDGQTVILGRRTYGEMKPMLGTRLALVVSRADETVEDAATIHDLPAYLEGLAEDAWIIGGGPIFALVLPYATELYLTRVTGDFDCDVFFPEFEDGFTLTEKGEEQEENGIKFRFEVWRVNSK